jgi:hypothetical protein
MEVTMSLQDELRISRGKPRAFYMPVTCLRCDAPMKIKTITPRMTFAPLDAVVYACPACKIEIEQIVLRLD